MVSHLWKNSTAFLSGYQNDSSRSDPCCCNGNRWTRCQSSCLANQNLQTPSFSTYGHLYRLHDRRLIIPDEFQYFLALSILLPTFFFCLYLRGCSASGWPEKLHFSRSQSQTSFQTRSPCSEDLRQGNFELLDDDSNNVQGIAQYLAVATNSSVITLKSSPEIFSINPKSGQ